MHKLKIKQKNGSKLKLNRYYQLKKALPKGIIRPKKLFLIIGKKNQKKQILYNQKKLIHQIYHVKKTLK